MLDFIIPDWPAPPWVKAVTSTRHGGFSMHPFDSLNLSHTVGDNLEHVLKNRSLLKKTLQLSQEPIWLNQIHGAKVISADHTQDKIADAIYTDKPNRVCTILTADCLPILICSKTQPRIAAIHAGWKGLVAGVIENSILALKCPPEDLLVWLGPAIGPEAFVVGEDVLFKFLQKSPALRICFEDIGNKHWLANLYQLAKYHLLQLRISAVYGGQHCTYKNKTEFFSFRRDNLTGRLASLIWLS